jgi:GntR family transcriptional regulator
MAIDANYEQKTARGRPKNDQGDAVDLLSKVADNGAINRESATPLWVQLKNALTQAIESKLLSPDSRLPSENTLCEVFDVSRQVVRAALGALSDEGVLTKVPRSGIFVAQNRGETDFITSNVSVHSDLEARGHKVTSESFEFRRDAPDRDELRVFNLPPDGTVVRVGRIYHMDGRPITHTVISLPGHKVPEMEKLLIEGTSIFEILKNHFGLVSRRAERWLTAEIPPAIVAERLQIDVNQPLIAIESIAYDSNDAPLEYYRAYYNSSVARIHVSTGTFKN